MTNDAYGSLGNEMKAMKDGRANLMAGIKDNRKRIRDDAALARAAAQRFVAATGQANQKLATQTRQRMAQAHRDLKARTRQTLDEAGEVAAAIRKDVAALKADAGRILAAASGFLAEAGSGSAQRRLETRRMLAHARGESKARTRQALAEAGKVMSQTKEAVTGLRTETGLVLADATDVMRRLSESSRQRAAGWRGILHVLHGNGSPAAGGAVRAAPAVKSPRKTAAKRTKVRGKTYRRRVA